MGDNFSKNVPQDADGSPHFFVPASAGCRKKGRCRYAATLVLLKCGAGAPRSRHKMRTGRPRSQLFPREFLVFCAFFEEEQTAPLNKVQVWGYSDAVANATAPCWPAMFAKLPNRPCDWKAPQLHCLSDVNPCVKLSRVAILLSLFPQ